MNIAVSLDELAVVATRMEEQAASIARLQEHISILQGRAAREAENLASAEEERDEARVDNAALLGSLTDLIHVVADAGTWCDSAVVKDGSAWHVTTAEDQAFDAALERAQNLRAEQHPGATLLAERDALRKALGPRGDVHCRECCGFGHVSRINKKFIMVRMECECRKRLGLA